MVVLSELGADEKLGVWAMAKLGNSASARMAGFMGCPLRRIRGIGQPENGVAAFSGCF